VKGCRFWLLAFGFSLLAFRFWLFAFGFSLLAFGFWLFVLALCLMTAEGGRKRKANGEKPITASNLFLCTL